MLRILLVDDESTEREGMKFLIEKYQFPLQITEAQNGKKGLAYVKEHAVDIVLTDIKMPFMDGLELAEAVSQLKPKVKIIIFSAYGEFDYAKRAIRANVVSYLLKPIEVDEFKKVMTDVISRCEEEKAAADLKDRLDSTDKKMLLYQIFSGQLVEQGLISGLERHGIRNTGKYVQVLHLEAKNSLFADQEELFLNFVKMYCPCHFEYVSIYPDEAGLFLFSPTKLSRQEVERFAGKLMGDTAQFGKEGLFIVAGKAVTELRRLTAEVNLIQEMCESIFGCDSGVLFTEDMQNFNEFYGKEILNWKKEVERTVEEKNLEAMEICLDKMLTCISNSKGMSIVYMHYIFYDLLNKMYLSFGIHDDKLLADRIAKVVKCRSYEEMAEIFGIILREIAKERTETKESQSPVAAQVIRLIRNEYGKELTLDYLAEQVNVVPSYLSFLFKKETGDTLIKYITDFRMNKAKELLQGGNLKIVQVAKQCGYENTSYFNRLFKDCFGLTPKQYREKRIMG